MKRELKSVHVSAGLLVLSVLMPAGPAAGQATAPVLPVEIWQVRSPEGDKVALRDEDGTLRIDFDVDVRAKRQLGHMNFNRADFRLLLRRPIPLSDEKRRVMFEACGMRKVRDRQAELQILPIIRDERGELLIYEPHPCPHLREGSANWGKWTTRYFYGAEAGGATQNIFEAAGGDGNAWPDGELTFVGFEVQLQPPNLGRQSGTLHLADVEFGGMRIGYEDPYLYADAVLKDKGAYRLGAGISDAFQALPLREFVTEIQYDPASPASRRQRIVFPLPADGNYWIGYRVTDAQGRLVAMDDLRCNAEGNAAGEALKPVDPAEPPALGYVRINPLGHTAGVYETDEPLAVTVRVFPAGQAGAAELRWRLMPYAFDTVIEQGVTPVDPAGKPFADVELKLTGEPGRDAYRLAVELAQGEKVIDSRQYVLGRKTDFSKPRATRQGLIRGREYVKKSAYFRTTFRPADGIKSEDEQLSQFVRYLDEASRMAPYVTYMIDLADLEVLPGVYDLAVLDRVMDAAADRGCAVTVRTCHVDAEAAFRWLPYTRQRSYDGTEIYNHFYGCYAPTDPVYVGAWLRANRALYDRYRTHPGFQGYYLMMAGGEWSTLLDKPWLGVVAGYDAPTQESFRQYLREELKLSLAQLNRRWNSDYKSWPEVSAPLPDFAAGARPDMRINWLDFCRFKDYINREFWFATLVRDIRSYDKDRVVIAYCAEGDELKGMVDYSHGGGVPSLPGWGQAVELWEKYRVGAIQEPHHPYRWNSYGDPDNAGWVLDWDLYTMFSIAGAGGTNIHVYYYPLDELPRRYGGEHAYDRYERFKPLFRELHTVKLLTQPVRQVATYQDPTTLFCKHRTSFPHRLPDLARWFELLTFAGVEAEPLRRDRLDGYKLVLPNLLDEELSAESIEMLDGYTRGGGRMIISAITGRYCPELAGESFPLLRRLGIDPPAGAYVLTGRDVRAEVVADNPLFDKGAGVKFYTLDNLRADPQRKEIQQQFFKWPYRWIPQTDYFGYFRDNKATNGPVLARFADGGVAVSRHAVGKGEVIVFWGVPECRPEQLTDMMARAAKWASVADARSDNPIPLMMQGFSELTARRYAILWQARPGSYVQKIPGIPEGSYFIEDLLSDCKLGAYTAAELAGGLKLEFLEGYSPLKVLRMNPIGPGEPGWATKYRRPPEGQR